jgi:selenide,water dikinase
VLFDPQTSGGLLAGIPADRSGDCLAQLRSAGYEHAVTIGRIVNAGSAPIQVTGNLAGSPLRRNN